MKLHEGFFRPFRQSDAQAQTAFIDSTWMHTQDYGYIKLNEFHFLALCTCLYNIKIFYSGCSCNDLNTYMYLLWKKNSVLTEYELPYSSGKES